jgi:hypothetical protein
MIQQTKSRPRHSNDNGLAESKKRRHRAPARGMGTHSGGARRTDPAVQPAHLNPYLNCRPCVKAKCGNQCERAKTPTLSRYPTPCSTEPGLLAMDRRSRPHSRSAWRVYSCSHNHRSIQTLISFNRPSRYSRRLANHQLRFQVVLGTLPALQFQNLLQGLKCDDPQVFAWDADGRERGACQE